MSTASSERDVWQGNEATVAMGQAAAPVGYADLEALFDMHYERIRRQQAAHSRPGILSLAFDLGSAQLVAHQWTKTRSDAPNAATLGRHDKCDLQLAGDPSVSLRHLLLVTHPYRPESAEKLAFRILDLRSAFGFQDCFSNRLQAVVCDGPTLLTVGRYAIMLAPTGGVRALPGSRREAWDLVADPLYVEQHTHMPLQASPSQDGGEAAHRRSAVRSRARADDEAPGPEPANVERTSVTILDGPERPGRALLAPGETILGTLDVMAQEQSRALSIGASAAHNGVLIGCYDRCDDAWLSHLSHGSVSRVHLLLLGHGGDLYAIDTASTNGTFVQQPHRRVRVRMAKLAPSFELVLADDRARLRWTPHALA